VCQKDSIFDKNNVVTKMVTFKEAASSSAIWFFPTAAVAEGSSKREAR
jgi:hypothetical protein